MRSLYGGIILCILCIGLILAAGCFTYAEPEISMNASLKQVSTSPETNSITYDVTLNVENTGSNNAYDLAVMLLVSTPKDLPEYRFINENIEIGTLPKHESTSVIKQVTLTMTPDNYNRIISGERQAEVEPKVMRVSSNVMG